MSSSGNRPLLVVLLPVTVLVWALECIVNRRWEWRLARDFRAAWLRDWNS